MPEPSAVRQACRDADDDPVAAAEGKDDLRADLIAFAVNPKEE